MKTKTSGMTLSDLNAYIAENFFGIDSENFTPDYVEDYRKVIEKALPPTHRLIIVKTVKNLWGAMIEPQSNYEIGESPGEAVCRAVVANHKERKKAETTKETVLALLQSMPTIQSQRKIQR